MTWQMMLALAMPPSAAYVIGKVLAWLESRALAVAEDQVGRLDTLHADALAASNDLTDHFERIKSHEAELKRLGEQITTLQERVYR